MTEELRQQLEQDLAPDLEVIRHISDSATATVFLAREVALKRLVVVKVLAPELACKERAVARFEREAQAAASLTHPNVVAVHSVGRMSNGTPYMVMQHVKGRSMESRLAAEGPLPPTEVRHIVAEVASVLAAAHQNGIVHRDVTPANILQEEQSGRILLSDFGIVAVLSRGDAVMDERLTLVGEVLGNPMYSPPEQKYGGDVSDRSDIFSLGVTAYQLLTEKGIRLRMNPGTLYDYRTDVDPVLARLLERCVEMQPDSRPSARDISRRLSEPATSTITSMHVDELTGAAANGPLIERLQSKRLPQWLGAYIVAGFMLLEGTDMLADRGIIPEIVWKLYLATYACGMAAVAIVAWYHGAPGRQSVTPVEVALLSAVTVVWLMIGGVMWATV